MASSRAWLTGSRGLTVVHKTELEQSLLPEFLSRQRWFSGKARQLTRIRIIDHSRPGRLPHQALLLILEVSYADGGTDCYSVPLAEAVGGEIARIEKDFPRAVLKPGSRGDEPVLLYDALIDDEVCRGLLRLIELDASLPMQAGAVQALRLPELQSVQTDTGADVPVRRGSAEQSNSNLLLGDHLIMKVFRRLEAGTNPDLEVGRFLTTVARFGQSPRTLGALEYYRDGSESITLALLQELMANDGTGWEFALRQLTPYFETALRHSDTPPPLAKYPRSWLELIGYHPPVELDELLGPGLQAASLLGERTAELHLALASRSDIPEFAPEPWGTGDSQAHAGRLMHQAQNSLDSLQSCLPRLSAVSRSLGQRLLSDGAALVDEFSATEFPVQATRIRVHGDYHLGQVLRTGDDYLILDFEGEPFRPLSQRRAKDSPLRDVVGMLRSFDYVAHAGLIHCAGDNPEILEELELWAGHWCLWCSATFLKAYLAACSGADFIPDNPEQLAWLMRLFELEKAFYELQYELGHRPAWARIPLASLTTLCDQHLETEPRNPR